jgi:hypothetical protein
MHPQRDLSLAAVTAEVTLADKKADEDAKVEIGEHVFHRRVSRGTGRPAARCFTVM